jgi:GxxExxY protein
MQKLNHNERIKFDIEQYNAVTDKIIFCAFKVSNSLGVGFNEKVYENALYYEVGQLGFEIQQQMPIQVYYEGIIVGDYIADLVVEKKILVELKAVRTLDEIHHAQCINYLKATGYHLCLLINFGQSKIQIRRIVN